MDTNLGRYDYYEILEVNNNAHPADVSKAYERAKFTYSGNNPAIYTIFSEQEARELLKMIEEAYAVIGNKTLRSVYDQKIQSRIFTPDELSYENLAKSNKIILSEKVREDMKLKFTANPEFEEEIKNATHWDGELLKKVREYKQVTIERMAQVTKINSFYISAIEEMDPSNLPATVFIRGYVIQIARFLHLDDKKVPDSYMAILKAKLKK